MYDNTYKVQSPLSIPPFLFLLPLLVPPSALFIKPTHHSSRDVINPPSSPAPTPYPIQYTNAEVLTMQPFLSLEGHRLARPRCTKQAHPIATSSPMHTETIGDEQKQHAVRRDLEKVQRRLWSLEMPCDTLLSDAVSNLDRTA